MSAHPKETRQTAIRKLPPQLGVYALCDLDRIPIYVGKSSGGKAEGIRARVSRHLTSARSDVVANRMIDIWEVAYVMAWPCDTLEVMEAAEGWLYSEFELQSRLMNGRSLNRPASPPILPSPTVVQVLDDAEIARRRELRYRLPRQVQHLAYLLDYLLEVKNERHVRRSLEVHFERASKYQKEFQDSSNEAFPDDSDSLDS